MNVPRRVLNTLDAHKLDALSTPREHPRGMASQHAHATHSQVFSPTTASRVTVPMGSTREGLSRRMTSSPPVGGATLISCLSRTSHASRHAPSTTPPLHMILVW